MDGAYGNAHVLHAQLEYKVGFSNEFDEGSEAAGWYSFEEYGTNDKDGQGSYSKTYFIHSGTNGQYLIDEISQVSKIEILGGLKEQLVRTFPQFKT